MPLRWQHERRRRPGAAQVAYASAKAGVIQFSWVVAVQHAPDGIRVNTVVPGQLHTPMVEARLAGQRSDGDVEKLLRDRQARIPLGFMGTGGQLRLALPRVRTGGADPLRPGPHVHPAGRAGRAAAPDAGAEPRGVLRVPFSPGPGVTVALSAAPPGRPQVSAHGLLSIAA